MTKIRLGTIGTSWITDSFIAGALATNLYELSWVYSRNEEKGETFGSKYGDIPVETDLEEFVNKEDLDVIYIASPNILHYEQALLALKAQKHVIVEKPATINVEQWDEMIAAAEENDVFVMEAARHMHIPNLELVKEEVEKLGTIHGATLPYVRYSSRYDNVRAGEDPNIFSLDFAGGALMDLGIYPIYTAVALFGKPKEVFYFTHRIRTGVDGFGTAILRYEDFDVTILVGKNATSAYEVEIYGEDETLILDHVSNLNEAHLLDVKTFEKQEVTLVEQLDNDMTYEAKAFADMIMNKDSEATKDRYNELSDIARIVSGILYDLRADANIRFAGEEA